MMKKVIWSSILVLCLSGLASAALSDVYPDLIGAYTDMTPDNTWPSSDPDRTTLVLADWYKTGNGSGSIWGDRSSGVAITNDGTSDGGDVCEGTTGSLLPMLTTTIGGLDPAKIYDVYVVYWSKINYETANDYFGVMASMSGATLARWDLNNADVTFKFGATIAAVNGCEAKLGQVSGVTEVSIDVGGPVHDPFYHNLDDDPELTRAWYDGVALVEVPEPATMILLGLGGLLGLRRRR